MKSIQSPSNCVSVEANTHAHFILSASHLFLLMGLTQVALSCEVTRASGYGHRQSGEKGINLHLTPGPRFLHLYDKGFPKIISWATPGSRLGTKCLISHDFLITGPKAHPLVQNLEKPWLHGTPKNRKTYSVEEANLPGGWSPGSNSSTGLLTRSFKWWWIEGLSLEYLGLLSRFTRFHLGLQHSLYFKWGCQCQTAGLSVGKLLLRLNHCKRTRAPPDTALTSRQGTGN